MCCIIHVPRARRELSTEMEQHNSCTQGQQGNKSSSRHEGVELQELCSPGGGGKCQGLVVQLAKTKGIEILGS